jgi:TolB-like protein/class 3 adenylate cyclase/Flp pilus assembly protein TadD
MQQERTLAVIMFTDIVGYTTLMESSEDEALHLLEINRQLINSAVSIHQGQWVKEIGDGTLSTFHSTLDALHCAFEIIKAINKYPKLNLRIALHLGDIVHDEHDIYSDSVNIAARLQHLSPINGIAISQHFYAQIQGKSSDNFQSIGFPYLKNISNNIEVFIWDADPQAVHTYTSKKTTTTIKNTKAPRFIGQWRNIAAVLIFTMIGITSYFLWLQKPSTKAVPAKITTSNITENSIAVLKFKNIGDQKTTNYFNEGLSEELLNLLARIKELKVASRTSSWALSEQTSSAQVRKKLNVNYMVEGSVRKSKDRVRVTAQLIDTNTGFHLWSETYDRKLSDIITIQDEIANKITDALKILLSAQSQKSISSPSKVNVLAYDHYLKAKKYLRQPRTLSSLQSAQQHFNSALAVDDSLILAFAGLCQTEIEVYRITQQSEDFNRAEKNCNITLKLNDYQSENYNALGNLYLVSGRYQDAEKSFQAALTLDLNSSDALIGLGQTLAKLDQHIQAEQFFQRAIKTAPNHAKSHHQYANYLLKQGNYPQAITEYKKTIALTTNYAEVYNGLGAVYFASGDFTAGIQTFQQSLKIIETKEALSNLGTAFFMQKDFTQAAAMYKRAIKLSPDDYRFSGFLAECYEQLPTLHAKVKSTYQQAIKQAEKSLLINPNNNETLVFLALYHAKINNKNKSLQLLTTLKNKQLSANLLYLNSISYLNLGEQTLAINSLSAAIDKGYPRELVLNDDNFKTLTSNKKFNSLITP